jgi:tetratricopeptide (TPR) repeat protein
VACNPTTLRRALVFGGWLCAAGVVTAQDARPQQAAPATAAPGPGAAAAAKDPADRLVADGDAHVRAGQTYAAVEDARADAEFEHAIDAFKQAIALAPARPVAYYRLADLYDTLHRPGLSVPLYKQIRAMLPGESMAAVLQGIAEFDLDQYEQAVTTLRGAVGMVAAPGTLAIANRYLGASYYFLKRYADAVAPYREAMRLDPGYAQASEELGLSHYRLGQIDDALAAHETSVRLEPGNAEYQLYLGRTYVAARRRDDALRVYATLKTLDATKARQLDTLINPQAPAARP